MREPTRQTRILRIGISTYFVVFVIAGWVLLVSPVSTALTTGHQLQAKILIFAWLFWTSVVSLLTYGSLKRWRWAFWVYVVLLTAVVAESILGTNTTTIPLVSDLITGIIGAGLLI